jgi:hypothetical protein
LRSLRLLLPAFVAFVKSRLNLLPTGSASAADFAAIALLLNALKIASEIKKPCQAFFVAAFSDAYHCCAWLLARSATMLAMQRGVLATG